MGQMLRRVVRNVREHWAYFGLGVIFAVSVGSWLHPPLTAVVVVLGLPFMGFVLGRGAV